MASSRVYERGERGNDWTFFFFLPVNNQKADKKKMIKAKQLRLNNSMSKQRGKRKEWQHSFSPEKKN